MIWMNTIGPPQVAGGRLPRGGRRGRPRRYDCASPPSIARTGRCSSAKAPGVHRTFSIPRRGPAPPREDEPVTPRAPVVDVRSLHVRFGEVEAVAGVDLAAYAGH